MKIWIALLTLFTLTGFSNASSQKDLATFQMVWDTINEKHWDLQGLGVDWQEIHKKYKPQVEKASSRAETRKIITAMLGELGQSHFRILQESSTKALESLMAQFPGGSGYPGFEVSLIQDRVYITRVDEGSNAATRKLAIGMEILKLDQKEIAPIVVKLKDALKDNAHADMYIARTLNSMFTGPVGSELVLRIAGQKEPISIIQERQRGKYVALLNFPSLYYFYEAKVLEDNIGYVNFNIFTMESKNEFVRDLTGKLKDVDGLIIDLRGNPGGLGLTSVAMAARLIPERGKRLGHMTNKGGTMNFAIFPQKPQFDKPVAILIDGASASTSEILAAGLQDLGRVRLFGSRSAGAALPSVILELPNGDSFQYAIADYTSYQGRTLEGVGVTPDVKTPHSLDSMALGVDASIEGATRWLISEKKTGAKNEGL